LGAGGGEGEADGGGEGEADGGKHSAKRRTTDAAMPASARVAPPELTLQTVSTTNSAVSSHAELVVENV
tara:strand:+ start:466 stop:672 length:207 start_codon:yes stop_codon:yes gene_type:complete